jgi:hypothetical protein
MTGWRAGYGPPMTDTPRQRKEESEQQDGQVSEAPGAAGDTPVVPGDSVAGHPDDTEAARTQEGTQGPDAPPRHGQPESGNESSR